VLRLRRTGLRAELHASGLAGLATSHAERGGVVAGLADVVDGSPHVQEHETARGCTRSASLELAA
jgi:hypothetical protein